MCRIITAECAQLQLCMALDISYTLLLLGAPLPATEALQLVARWHLPVLWPLAAHTADNCTMHICKQAHSVVWAEGPGSLQAQVCSA